MAVCDAEPLALALESTSPADVADIQQSLNAEFENLRLDEKSEEKSEGLDQDSKSDGENEESDVRDSEPSGDEKPREGTADGWGSDAEKEKSDEVKAEDGWGWDQDFSAAEGNQEFVKYPELASEEKEETWGWGAGDGRNEENVEFEKGLEILRDDNGQRQRSPFPVRPNEPDCSFYVRTGTCRFGLNCKFNHPPSKTRNKVRPRKMSESGQVVEVNENRSFSELVGQTQREKAYKEQKRGTLSESNGQMDCKYYTTPGGCKYGSFCKYNHKEKTETPTELNFLGLPKRPGEKECTYYMSTGSCKYSINCRFHHPDPIAVGGQEPSSGYQNGGSSQLHAPPTQLPMTSWPLQRAPNEPVPFLDAAPYVTGFFLPPQGLHPNPEWNGYQAPVNPLFPAEMNVPHPPSAPALEGIARKGIGSTPRKVPDGDYPERPGQPECQFFMKTGTCKFKSACKFHHPKSRLPKTSDVNVNPVGLPLRPDQPVCSHYSRHGVCKYGQSCRFNHPMDSSPWVPSSAIPEPSQKVFPESSVESQEVNTECTTDQVQESEW